MVIKRFTDLLIGLERITQPVTDFIRGNPIVSTAVVGIGTTGVVTAVARVRKRRKVKKKKAKKRKRKRKAPRRRKAKKRRKVSKKRRRKVTHRRPRHKGHKRVSFTTAEGKKVNFLVKRKPHTHRVKRRKR